MICPNCNNNIDDNSTFCPLCGCNIVEFYEKLREQDKKQCPFCGETIKAQAKKCRYCGKWLNEENSAQVIEEATKTKQCPFCGEEILFVAKKCKHCGERLNGLLDSNLYNTYNKSQKQLPYELQKFNWGAFGLSWIWGMYNNSYITFWYFASLILLLVPFIGALAPLGFGIWFGIKGNEWAWNNKEWRDVEHFNSVQEAWAKAVIILAGIVIWAIFGTLIYFGLIAMYASILANLY